MEQLGFTHVETEQHGLLAIKGINGGHVDAVEGLAYALSIARDENDALWLTLRDVFDIGSDGAERLGNRRLGVVDDYKRVLVAGLGHSADDGESRQLFDIFAIGNACVEEILQEEIQSRDEQAENEGNEHVHCIPWCNPDGLFDTGFIQDFIVRRVGSTEDLGFGATLHQIFIGVVGELVISLVIDEFLLLGREFLRLRFEGANAAVDFVEAHLCVFNEVVDGFQQGFLRGEDLLVEFHDLRVLLGLGEQLGGLVLRKHDEVAGQLVEQRVVDTHRAGCSKVLRVVDLYLDIILHTGVNPHIDGHLGSFFGEGLQVGI